jgi:hypothetical protein
MGGHLCPARPHPLVSISPHAAAGMLEFAGESGMTPATRSRFVAGIGGSSVGGKFEGLVG